MSKLLAFLESLGSDASVRKRYHAAPKAAMLEAGLGEAEIEMILNGDIEGIRKAVGRDDVYLTVIIHYPDMD